MKKLIIGITALVLVVFFLVLRGEKKTTASDDGWSETILFVGATCPHCKNVEDWLGKNQGVKEKAHLVEKEVYYNQENAKKLAEKVSACGLETGNGISVPFLFDQGECVIGDQPIIDYLSGKYQ